VALNFEYTHTWWQDAHFDSPAASPFFNYTFRRQDDLFKFGFTVALSPSAPAAEPPIPVKARPSKYRRGYRSDRKGRQSAALLLFRSEHDAERFSEKIMLNQKPGA
jgi:hypothetical protein